MTISKVILTLAFGLSLFTAPAFAQKDTQTTDYIVPDYGSFIRDNTNFNGILRVIKSTDGSVSAEVSAAKTVEVDSRYETQPFLITAELALEETPKSSFKITKVTIKDQSYGKDLIFKVGGIINPNGTNSFGGPELQYRDTETSFPRMGTSFERVDR